MNKIFLFFIVASFIIAIGTGKMPDVSDSVLTNAKSAVDVCFVLIGVMTFWLGIMKIAEKSGLIEVIGRIIRPIISFLFPDVKNDKKTTGDITMNVSANLLGLGNAATPFGIKAMEGLQKHNIGDQKTASDSMCTFLTINTAGIQLIPITVIAIVSSAGNINPTEIIIPTIITTFASLILGVCFVKFLIKIRPKGRKK